MFLLIISIIKIMLYYIDFFLKKNRRNIFIIILFSWLIFINVLYNKNLYERKKYDDNYYINNYRGGELEPEWQWVKNITILYTWVDGSDPNFLKTKAKYNGGKKEINSRFRSADELKYSIRSVEKYMPWHEGDIIIFTAQQIPHWLNTTNPRIKMIFHKDVIPKYITPTYDSDVIELYFDKIPGISEQFIYFNDDVFVNNYVHPAFFFTTKEHYPRIYLSNKVYFNKKKINKEIKRNSIHNNFYAKSYHTDLIIKKYFDPNFQYYYLEHVAHVFYRDLMELFRHIFEEEIKVVVTDRFRNPYKPHILYLFLMFQYFATQHHDFPNKLGDKREVKNFKGYKLPENRTIQKFSAVLSYPKNHKGRVKYGEIKDNLKSNLNKMIYYKTHPEILFYNFNDKYTKEEVLYQFTEYLISRYPWPTLYEKKEYVNLENIIYSQLNETKKLKDDLKIKDNETKDNLKSVIISEKILNNSLFQQRKKIMKEYFHLKDNLIIKSKNNNSESDELNLLQSYINRNESLKEKWNWVKYISMVFIFDRNEDMEIKKLKYSIQSIIKYLPWFKGKIFIVIPNVIRNNLKFIFEENNFKQIELVTWYKFIPREYRQKYNTQIIEMNLDRIPGISEKFIYLNNNHFFIKYTHPSLFFSNEGFYPKYNLQPPLKYKEMRKQRKDNISFYNTFKLIKEYFGSSYVHYWRFLKNSPCPLYRDLFEPVRDTFKEQLNKSFIEDKNHTLLPIYLVINYNIYATDQIYYPNYVSGYGKIRETKPPVLNDKRTVDYYGFEEISLYVYESTMITDISNIENLCNNEKIKKSNKNNSILFFSISNTDNTFYEESIALYLVKPYFDDKCFSKSTNVKVSIILPIYNCAQYLDNSIKNIFDQTLKDIELIIINDASTDNTIEILRKYKNESKITIINLQNNGGQGRARNIGIEIAKGEFIGFMNSDDFLDEKFFEHLFKNSKDKDIVIGYLVNCINNSYYCCHNKEQNDYDSDININNDRKNKTAYGFVCNSIWRKEFLYKKKLKFSLQDNVMEDQIFRNKCYSQKPRISKIPDEGIYYYSERRIGTLNPNNKNS